MDIKTELYDIAYQAYYNSSFDPERRRDSIIADMKEELTADLISLGENTGNYESKYIAHARNWLGRKSRCISVMITGPANFPVARNQKALNSEDKAWQDFRKWRTRYSKAVNRVHNLSPEDDMDLAIKKVDKLIIAQETMKTANKITRQKNKSTDEKIQEMIAAGLSEKLANSIMEPDCFGGIGFQSFKLTNNNAKIKAAKNKVLIMKNRIRVKADFEPITFDGGVINIEADRVTIKHDDKPERDVIDKLNSRGFHWSWNYGCWSRKHTAQALCDAKKIVGIDPTIRARE